MIKYSGGDGSSPESAVRIEGANGESEGIAAEYAWLRQKFGGEGKGFTLEMQSLFDEGVHKFDRMDIVLADGTRKSVYFDITGFFGK